MKEIYTAMRNKTHENNALYQISAVCFEHLHELVIAELQLVSIFIVTYMLYLTSNSRITGLQEKVVICIDC